MMGIMLGQWATLLERIELVSFQALFHRFRSTVAEDRTHKYKHGDTAAFE
jgi:hypothetical protein